LHIQLPIQSERSCILKELFRKKVLRRTTFLVGAVLFILYMGPVSGQSATLPEADPGKNTIYFSGIGLPLFIFLQYERQMFTTASRLVRSVNAGAGGGAWKASSAGGYGIGINLNSLSGPGAHHLEVMIGVIGTYDRSGYQYEKDINGEVQRGDYIHFLPHGCIGYRYQPPGRGWMFRIGLGFPTLQLGAGYSF